MRPRNLRKPQRGIEMEDLFPLLIFIVIVIINVLKAIGEKKGRRPPSEASKPEPQPPRPGGPATLEDFFDEIARKFQPQPTEVAEWPENIERPDYTREMEEYEAAQLKKREEPSPSFTAPAPEPESAPLPNKPFAAATMDIVQPRALGKSSNFKIPAQGAVFAGMSNMRISMPPLLRSATGHIDFRLENKNQLKQALISSMVFGSPRAYDRSFNNTMAK